MAADLTPPGSATDLLLVNGETARAILGGISARLLFSLTKSGQVPCVRIGRRVLYDVRDLAAYVDGHKTRGGRP